MAELHQLQSRGHLRVRVALILTPSPTLCNRAGSSCPGMPRTSAKSRFPQKCPTDEGFLTKPSVSAAEAPLYQGDHERLARGWAFNTLNVISLILSRTHFMHNGGFPHKDDLPEGTSILKRIAKLLQFGQGDKCLVFHLAERSTSPVPLSHNGSIPLL